MSVWNLVQIQTKIIRWPLGLARSVCSIILKSTFTADLHLQKLLAQNFSIKVNWCYYVFTWMNSAASVHVLEVPAALWGLLLKTLSAVTCLFVSLTAATVGRPHTCPVLFHAPEDKLDASVWQTVCVPTENKARQKLTCRINTGSELSGHIIEWEKKNHSGSIQQWHKVAFYAWQHVICHRVWWFHNTTSEEEHSIWSVNWPNAVKPMGYTSKLPIMGKPGSETRQYFLTELLCPCFLVSLFPRDLEQWTVPDASSLSESVPTTRITCGLSRLVLQEIHSC